MKGLAGLVLGLIDLLEAEGALLRENVLRTVRQCVILSLGLIFAGAALAFFVASTYTALAIYVSRPMALAIIGIVCALLSVTLLWIVKISEKPARAPDSGDTRDKAKAET